MASPFGAPGACLLVVALVQPTSPARRAARIDPVATLRFNSTRVGDVRLGSVVEGDAPRPSRIITVTKLATRRVPVNHLSNLRNQLHALFWVAGRREPGPSTINYHSSKGECAGETVPADLVGRRKISTAARVVKRRDAN